MSKEILAKIQKDKKYNYGIDRNGNVWRDNYKFYKDKYFKWVLIMLFLSLLYWVISFQSGECNKCISIINNPDNLTSLCNNLTVWKAHQGSSITQLNVPLNFTTPNG